MTVFYNVDISSHSKTYNDSAHVAMTPFPFSLASNIAWKEKNLINESKEVSQFEKIILFIIMWKISNALR